MENRYFYLANYGTEKNIEIFDNYNDAKSESSDDKVFKALLNEQNVYFEDGLGWNYEDNSELYLSTPVEIDEY